MKRFALAFLLSVAFPVLAVNVGQPAPDFTLSDLSGKSVKLSDLKGKLVVLEWVNPDCPYVQKHYNSANMPGLQKEYSGKVTWLTINSPSLGT